MSFYDDASLVFLAGGAAGKDGKAYNLKPVEELSSTEVVINGDFSIDGPGADGELDTSYGNYGWNTVTPSAGTQEGTTTISNGVLKLTNALGETDSRAYATDGVSSRNVITTNTYYKLVYTIVENNGCTSFKVYNAGGVQEDAPSSVGTHTVTLRNTSNQLFLFFNKTESSSISIDNVSIREITNQAADFTFTRGTNLTATRVGKDGYIEKGRENLLLYSNQFDSWTVVDATATSGQTGYDGTSDAWLFTTTVAGASLEKSITASGVVVFSMYAKKGTVDGIRLRIDAATDADAYFNLSNNSVHSFAGSAIDASITDLGGGWHRCEVSANISSPVKVAVYTTDGTTAYDNGNIYIQDAQLEQGLAATDYIETGATTAAAGLLEDEPRFDYTGGGCPALLLEPTRTNLIEQSEYFDHTSWIDASATRDITVTQVSETTPDGGSVAYKIQGTDVSNQLAAFNTIVIGDVVTNSIYVKRVSGTGDVRLRDVNNVGTDFSLSAADGWKRIDVTGTATSTSGRFYLNLITYTDEILVWGAQQEKGSFATSYIPTYGSSATRAKEGASDSYDQINTLDLSSSGLNGEDVSWFFEFRNNQDIIRDGSDPNVRVSEDLTNVGAFRIYRGVTSTTRLKVVLTANSGTSPTAYTITSDNPKVLIKRTWSTGRIQVYVDGVSVKDEINLNFDRWYKLDLAGHGSLTELKQVLAFPTVLSNNDSEILTGATSYSSFATMATSTPLNYTIYE